MIKVYFGALLAMLCFGSIAIGQTLTINSGAPLTPDHQSGPIYRSSASSAYDYSQFAYLYQAAELGSMGSGATINSLAWNKTNTGATTGPARFKIYMKNSSTTAYTTATPMSTLIAGATLVYDNSSVTIPATTGLVTFTLTTPFVYSGGSIEIMVDWDISAVSGSPSTAAFSWEKTTVASSILGYADAAPITTSLSPTSNSIGTITNTRPTLQIGYTAGAACSGPPTPGTTASTRTSVCAGLPFTLSVTGASSGVSGLIYQWQSSPNNTSWTDIPSATAISYSTTQTTSTYYRRKITCGASSDYSTPLMVAMNAAETIPYVESFETAVVPNFPECITLEDANGGTTWTTFRSATPSTFLPSTAARYNYSSTLPGNDWFYTKALSLTAGTTYQLRFRYGASDGPTYVEKLEVKIGSAPNSASMTSTLFSNTSIDNSVASLNALQADVAFTVPATGNYHVGFHAFSALDQAYLYIDSITVKAPVCSQPTNLSVTGITASGATFNWQAPSIGTAATYEYAFGTTSTLPASGTTTSALSASVNTLNSNTLYYLFVRTNCGSGTSDWQTYLFRTACGTQSIPYSENFESVVAPAPAPCLAVENTNADGTFTWGTSNNSTYLISGANSMVNLYNSSSATTPANDWFFTPALNLVGGTSYTLIFKYKASASFPSKLEVKYGTTATSGGMTSGTLLTNASVTALTNAQVAFTPAASGLYYIGFHDYSDPDMFYLSVDDIQLVTTASLPVTITQFKGERIGSSNKLTWATQTEANNAGFELQRSANGSVFTSMGYVSTKAAGGNSSTSITYEFTDTKPFIGTSYYRLKQIDKDAKSTISNIVTLKGGKITTLQLTGVYPNPATNMLSVLIASPAADKAGIVVTDIAGKTIISQQTQLAGGDNNVALDVSNLPSGTYFVKVACAIGCEAAVTKFVKQ